jgi:hypothetical protein
VLFDARKSRSVTDELADLNTGLIDPAIQTPSWPSWHKYDSITINRWSRNLSISRILDANISSVFAFGRYRPIIEKRLPGVESIRSTLYLPRSKASFKTHAASRAQAMELAVPKGTAIRQRTEGHAIVNGPIEKSTVPLRLSQRPFARGTVDWNWSWRHNREGTVQRLINSTGK